MSRQISRRYLFYLSVSAILTCGSSRRIPRGASCPSCSLDCPEALTAQLPWNARQESNLRDFSINPLRNSPYSRLVREGISQNKARDYNIPLSQNLMFFENDRRFPRQEKLPTSKHFLFKNYLNSSPKSLDTQEIFSQDKPAREYPLVVPSRQVFDISENLFFRNPGNKYSESLSEDYEGPKDYKEIEEDPANKGQVIFPPRLVFDRSENLFFRNPGNKYSESLLDEDYEGTKDYKEIEEDPASKVIVPSRSVFDRSENLFFRNPGNKYSESLSEDYEGTKDYKEIEEDPASKVIVPSRPVFDRSDNLFFKYPRDKYLESLSEDYERTKDYEEIEEDPASKGQVILPPRQVFDRSENLFFKYPRDKYSESLSEDYERTKDYKKIEENSTKVQAMHRGDRDIKSSRKNSKDTSNAIQSEIFLPRVQPMRKNPRPLEKEDDEDMKKYFEDETEQFMNEEDMKEYFEDETEQDTIETERDNYNPRVLPQNIWKGIEDEELLANLNFMRENSQETGQSGLYSKENSKYFQNEQNEDVIFQDKAYANAEAARAPVINAYNAYILPRYLNIVNDKKNPAKSETQELSEAKNSIRVNPTKEMDRRFFEDEAVIEKNPRIQDLILPKNILDVEKYNSFIANERNNVSNKNEAGTELDPDLLDDIEDPPVKTTELTPSTPLTPM
ncbi:uncharacterized protein LOC143899586 [Temnothorax americanus]|uniref:uncharacterized protein LOC143899586 n=1 Tax=Temnothorax americanus TaxID=1964332 RepID=UPI0040676958